MSSATKHDASVRAEVRLAHMVSGPLRLRRQTPLVAAAKADLELCRTELVATAPPSVTCRVSVSAIADLADKTRASLRSAYRPKPTSGGAYSVVGSVSEEQLAPARPSARPQRPQRG